MLRLWNLNTRDYSMARREGEDQNQRQTSGKQIEIKTWHIYINIYPSLSPSLSVSLSLSMSLSLSLSLSLFLCSVFKVDPTDRIGMPHFFALAFCSDSYFDTREATDPQTYKIEALFI